VPSHPILPDSRRAAIEAVFEEALAEVRAASDVALLHECRAIFRKKVPLSLRAYVAAAFALRLASAGTAHDQRRGKRHEEARPEPRSSDSRGKETSSRKPGDSQRVKQGAPVKAEVPIKTAPDRKEASERREPEIRENRYRGEGITLFVSAGRRQRFYARVAIKQLLETPGVSSEQIGDIRTMDNYSFIVVDPDVEETVLAALNGFDFKGRILAANRARKRGEPAPERSVDDASRPASVSEDRESGGHNDDGDNDDSDYRDEDEPFDDSDLDEFGSGSGELETGTESDSGDDTTEDS
jgi:hypothetical protein